MALTTTVRLWGPVLLVMALIFTASSVPDPEPLPGGVSDKTAHFAAYGLLSATIIRALAAGRLRDVTWRHVVGAVVLSTLYGAMDEVHQIMVPGRSPDAPDVLADAMGALGGAVAILALKTWLMRRAVVGRYTRSD